MKTFGGSGLKWQGIFELELLERSDGSYAAIDFNPHLCGSIAVAIVAGANLPALWTDWLMGRRVEPARSRPGKRYRLEEAELRNAMARVGERHPLAAMRILLPRRRVTHALFRWNDPGPFVASVAFRLGHLTARGAGW
jgi:predicted ATP-grasp superfamily ATP-dependent carboligase